MRTTNTIKRGFLYFQLLVVSFFLPGIVNAQCPGPYPNAAQLNWDNLDVYYNSGSDVAPYGFSTPSNGNYVTNTMEQTQRFAIGTATATFVISNLALINPGVGVSAENATHTGNLANYAGEDVQYNPTANGQSITITFNTPVWAPNFTLYDIDRSGIITVTATNNLNVATAVNVAFQPGTILAAGFLPLARTITANATTLGNAVNTGAATVTVPGAVNSITITVTTLGSDPLFFLSDINACVATAFPTNWHQGANNRPFWGPTQTMPDYFLGTPDDDGAYMIDPATATARLLFNDPAKDYINSFGYDPYNRFLYYITENPSIDYSNKQLKRYDYNTETSSVIINDITAAPFNIPTMNAGVESAACAFYNGSLYFGIEGGVYGSGGSTVTRETIVYRIDFNGSNNPISATQVYAINAGTNGSSTTTHDWGDIIIKNGMIYNCNTTRNGSDYSQSKFHHYNMMTGTVANVYNNPGTTNWNGQIAMTWAQNLFYFRGSTAGNCVVGTYDEAGTCGAPQTITKVGGGAAWPGGAGDASDPFRPKCDFGDAPASYDPYVTPATQSPAVHERADTMWIGTTTSEATSWDREFLKRGVNGSADTDNGVSTVQILQPGIGSYLIQVSLYNNSSANASVLAWLDYNGNGTFDASEVGQVIPSTPITPSGAVVTRYLYWNNINCLLSAGANTYLRIRLTSTAAGMTANHATGYFTKGEVEDYRVIVDNYPLATKLLNFDAVLQGKKVKLTWSAAEETGIYAYEIERSTDNTTWSVIKSVQAHNAAGNYDYQAIDDNPRKGVSYYRLKIIEGTGMNRNSAVKVIKFNEFNANLTIAPNPANDKTTLLIDVNESQEATIEIFNMQGKMVYTNKRRVNSGVNNIELSLTESFTSGTYIVKTNVGEQSLYKKLIVNK